MRRKKTEIDRIDDLFSRLRNFNIFFNNSQACIQQYFNKASFVYFILFLEFSGNKKINFLFKKNN